MDSVVILFIAHKNLNLVQSAAMPLLKRTLEEAKENLVISKNKQNSLQNVIYINLYKKLTLKTFYVKKPFYVFKVLQNLMKVYFLICTSNCLHWTGHKNQMVGFCQE